MQSQLIGFIYYSGWFFGLIAFVYIEAAPIKFEIKGKAAILMNAESGAVLFDYQAFTLHYPASTTKVATALYALKLCGGQLDKPIVAEEDSLVSVTQAAKIKSGYTLPPYWLEPHAVHIEIKKGEALTLRTLLQGMLISSGCDAANVIAHALGPTVPVFMEKLNAYLKEIGCQKTSFYNPHGLHHPQQQTNAYELALITREALKNLDFCEIVSQARFLRPKTNKQSAKTFLQTNRLLRPGKFYYSKAIGVKTGYHRQAQRNFIGAARVEERTLIVVLLGYQDSNAMFEDAIKLFEAAFNQPKVQRLFFKEGPQNFTLDLPKARDPICTYLPESVGLEYYPAEDPQVKGLLYWHPVSLPILKGQQVGEIQLVSAKGEVLKRSPLLAAKQVGLAWPYNWLAIFPSSFWGLFSLIGLVGALILIIFSFLRNK